MRAVSPKDCVRRALASRSDLDPFAEGTLIVAVGKAAAGMMRGAIPPGSESSRIAVSGTRAMVLLPEGSEAGELPPGVRVLHGGHPHPTLAGMQATERILAEVELLGRDRRLLFLLSGGASALLEAPAPGLPAEDLILAHRALVASGLPIRSINLVRGCLSAVKAGRLAQRAYPARVTTLAISDVEGDDAEVIGSGPTVPARRSHATACREALELVRAGDVELPAAALGVLVDGSRPQAPGSGSPANSGRGERTIGDPPIDYTVVASIADAVAGARAELSRRGYRADAGAAAAYLHGETRDAAGLIVDALGALDAAAGEPCSVVFGGETTVAVTVAGPGRGGRSLDLASRLALAIQGRGGIAVLAAGTDGRDGSSRAAGAIVDGGTAMRAERAGRAVSDALAAFDTEAALEAAGDLLVTGPTGTNVGDLVVAVARSG